jgi:hypothetical protein
LIAACTSSGGTSVPAERTMYGMIRNASDMDCLNALLGGGVSGRFYMQTAPPQERYQPSGMPERYRVPVCLQFLRFAHRPVRFRLHEDAKRKHPPKALSRMAVHDVPLLVGNHCFLFAGRQPIKVFA